MVFGVSRNNYWIEGRIIYGYCLGNGYFQWGRFCKFPNAPETCRLDDSLGMVLVALALDDDGEAGREA